MSALPPSERILEPAPAIAEVRHEHGLVVLLLDSPHCRPFELSGGGVEIWERLRLGLRGARQLSQEIALHNGIDPAEIEPSVAAFLEQLLEAGLLRPATTGSDR